ncbi:hypothetical protein, conserved [Leishmania tarentolae]|uniref:Uncharacterized protein n=1 Tax=Leishmania tarentolae TaxID=5689 RepID=A0A640KCF2_LEITA|nr:hypothetical protein, conserved [Leishmania tarentolae]
MMLLTVVDAYTMALKALDPTAWELLSALEDRILHSAACLLSRVERRALRPGVTGSGATVPPTAASHVQQAMTSGMGDADEADTALVTADVLSFLRAPLQADAIQKCSTRLDFPTTSTPARLAQELSRLRQQATSAQWPSSSPRWPGLILAELSISCQIVLVLAALWISTKFWATLCESSTLSGLVACFLRLSSSLTNDPTVAASDLECGTVRSPTSAERGPCTDGALDVVLVEPAKVDQLRLASTPPSSSLPPMTLEYPSPEDVWSAQVGAAGTLEGGAACVSRDIIIDRYDNVLRSPLISRTWLDSGVADAAESLARDIEDVEMVVLRCSEYAVPI